MSGRDNKQPYVRFFASDWLAGTRGMKASEMGIYITLISLMYERCEPIPHDDARLARQCGCTMKVFKATLEMLIDEDKVIKVDGGLWNKRVAKEFTFREENSKRAKQAVAERERKRNKNNGTSDRTIIERSSNDHPNHKPEAIPPLIPPEGRETRPAKQPIKFDDDVGVSQAVESAYLEHRRKKKAPPTAHAMGLLSTEIRKIRQSHGFAADEIVNHAILKGWTAFKASWNFDDLKGTPPPQSNGFRGKPRIDRFASDPELAQIRDQMKSGELQL